MVVSGKAAKQLRRGYPWVYRQDVESGEGTPGGVVDVVDGQKNPIGQALWASESPIALRLMGRAGVKIDDGLFERRLGDALRRRAAYAGRDAFRMVHGEADGLPGLVVDRYGDALSAQFLTPATEQRKELIADLLQKQFSAKAIVNRSDVGVRKLEGLEPFKGVMRGELTGPKTYLEGHVRLQADLLNGQKTGTFLDQRENHVLASTYARGEALDCFAYVGGFALQLATRATKVTAVEISEAACGLITANAAANGLSNVEVVAANAFDYLRDAVDEGKKFDTIVLDPPSFAKNKGAIEAATRGYKEINLRALQLLKPGGHLITCSCTYHVDEEGFEAMLDAAAADARRKVQIIEKRGAARDHPVLLGLRETRYLKCFVLRAL